MPRKVRDFYLERLDQSTPYCLVILPRYNSADDIGSVTGDLVSGVITYACCTPSGVACTLPLFGKMQEGKRACDFLALSLSSSCSHPLTTTRMHLSST